ncbi:protein of unknown function [Xenorhabdus nematophila AN6/1]|nr:hypothetical protein XNA1_4650025 [Xenorhabdus nematophila str. Anatoliense]CEE95746.1 hypothetical protein XNA1_630024 [Xenorhabdus nematophila str. Anatoliense]CEF33382.1 hypothetical protein XNW1_4730045 [Xenorhabdus nematophila str. Websteri]CEF33535.1 hypothetical protein XNW1_480047 [Xenorhabdus nematophila str. Websteri]CEK22550.1 protein of unknown function [Xenorhabdus nematophila AN6/1]
MNQHAIILKETTFELIHLLPVKYSDILCCYEQSKEIIAMLNLSYAVTER